VHFAGRPLGIYIRIKIRDRAYYADPNVILDVKNELLPARRARLVSAVATLVLHRGRHEEQELAAREKARATLWWIAIPKTVVDRLTTGKLH
jgi:hypothetical protein